jgi:A/G-specific adenine glycosylase
VKSKKTKVSQRYFNYLILEDELLNTIINKRTEKGIWHNLYQFPLIETQADENLETILLKMEQEAPFKNKVVTLSELNPDTIIHKLSHQHLHIKFWKVIVRGTLINGISKVKALEFPFPIVIYNFIENDFFEVI